MNCPICQGEPVSKYLPFCSARCADLDLGRWMRGHYRVPLEESDYDLDLDHPEADDATGMH